MKKIILGRGAEAIIYLEGDFVIKKRISKKYRHPELDKKIINRRTKSEIKLLNKTSNILDVPKLEILKEKDEIKMSFIKGLRLSDNLKKFSVEKQKKIMFKLGRIISNMHKEGIIHGDLTTSNIILKDNTLFLIDFGLGYFNGKYEDKGVDIHLLKQALEAKHFENWKTLFDEFKRGYSLMNKKDAKKVFEKISSIEKRGRYRH